MFQFGLYAFAKWFIFALSGSSGLEYIIITAQLKTFMWKNLNNANNNNNNNNVLIKSLKRYLLEAQAFSIDSEKKLKMLANHCLTLRRQI